MTDMTEADDTLIALLSEADPAAGAPDAARREAVRRRAIEMLDGSSKGRVRVDRPRARRRLALGLGGAALAATVAGLAVVIVGGSSVGPTSSPPFAAAAIRVAEANPRYLVDAPGWAVKSANEFDPDQGEIEFSNGLESLRILWAPERYYTEPDIEELRRGARGPEGSLGNPITPGPGEDEPRFEWITALGRRAFLDYDAGGRYYRLMFAPENGSYTTIEGHSRDDSMSRAGFLEIVGSLHSTDVETWLAALPPEIVRPVDNAATVDRMLEGIPIPDSVDPDQLRSLDLALTRYQLGAKVTGAVGCGWLDQWAAAVKSGDDASAQQAIDAMGTSRDWAILREMEDQGGWSQVVWEYAREMANDNRGALLGVAGTETTPDDRVYEISPSYATGLGCDSMRRTLRDAN